MIFWSFNKNPVGLLYYKYLKYNHMYLMNSRLFSLFLVSMLFFGQVHAQTLTENIRLNQVGFFSDGIKRAIAVDFTETTFEVWKSDMSLKVYSGNLTKRPSMISSCETNIQMADFSNLKAEGDYVIVIGDSSSYPFKIAGDVLNDVTKAQMKYYYYNRASAELKPEHAGSWARPAGHMNTNVLLYDAQTRSFSMPGGWYDAGDYGLYMVTASLAVTQILMAYEQFPEYWNKTELNIPESGNGVPDILDEVKYELQWMYKMKDPYNNGVYYKATAKQHAGFVMPDKDASQYYCMIKNATSAFDYAASFAMAARIFKNYETQFPGYSDSCLTAAIEAWTWGVANEVLRPSCTNPSGVSTGAYTDNVANNGNDNKVVAGVELFITTGDSTYLSPVLTTAENGFSNGEALWSEKRPVACMQLALRGNTNAQSSVIDYANKQLAIQSSNGYNVNIGNSNNDFNWGSSRRISNRGMSMMVAYLITKDKKYLDGVVNSMDYILGRNATAFSFITGFGTKQVMHPHHRISEVDTVIAPQPGLPIQGPYDGSLGTGCTPREVSACRAKNFIDNVCSFVSTELSIDQGSPNVFNLSGLMYHIGKNVIVDFVHPHDDALFTKDTSLSIEVNVVSKNGPIEKVHFYANDILVGVDSTFPYSFAWDSIPAGIYTLKAVGYDFIGDSASSIIMVTVGNASPRLTIDSPFDNFNLAPNSKATITTSASDRDGIITKVELYINDTLQQTLVAAPYVFETKSLPEGVYIIKVIAYDDADSMDVEKITINSACINFIYNGEFNSSKSGWALMLKDVAVASYTSIINGGLSGSNALKITTTNAGNADTSIIVQQDMPIYQGKKYYISYLAKADKPCLVKTEIIKNIAPFNTYFKASDSLSAVPKFLSYSFIASATDELARLNLKIGKQLTNIYFDKVYISECLSDTSLVLITFTEDVVNLIAGDIYSSKVLSVPNQHDVLEFIFTSSDTSVAVVDANGLITAKKTGTASVTVALASKPTTKDVLSVKVQTTSINEIDKLGVVVQPTLVTNVIHVYQAQNLNQIELYDLAGKQIYVVSQPSQTVTINTGHLAAGVYYLKLTAGAANQYAKHVKFIKTN